MLRLITLGALSLENDGSPLLPGRRKPLALLVWLALRRGRPTSREELATLLWGDAGEANARRSLRQCLSELRGVVGERLTESDAGLAIAPGAIALDVHDLRAALADGRFEAALELAGGEFIPAGHTLGPQPWQEWLAAERTGLQELRARAFLAAYGAAEERGEWRDARTIAERWRGALPDDPRAWVREVVALQSLGRLEEAAGCVVQARAHFVDTLGARMPEELARLARVIERLGEGTGASRTVVLTPELAGRGDALARLAAARQVPRDPGRPSEAAGGRRMTIVAADGMGKTRLLREYARQVRATDHGRCVVSVSALADERGRPWALAAQVVAQLVSHPALAGLPPEMLAGLATLAPALRHEYRHLADVPRPDAATVRDAVTRALSEVAQASGCLLILDDLPEADEESLDLFVHVLQRPPARTLVIAAGRPAGWHDRAPLRSVLARLDAAERVPLEALSRGEVERVVASMVPLGTDELARLSAAVGRLSSGHPGLVTSLVTHAAATGILARDARGTWRLAAPLDDDRLIGHDLRDRWRERTQDVGDGRAVLDALAVLSRHGPSPAPRALVEAVAALPPAALAAAGAQLVSAGLVAVRGDGWAFGSDAWRHLATQAMTAQQARAMHRRAAVALAGDPTHRAAAAQHRHAAGRGARDRLPWWAAAVALTLALGWGALRSGGATAPVGTPIVLADLDNLTGDTTFDRTLTLAAGVALQQSRQVALFPRARVRETLLLMQRPPADSILTESLAREVALRENLTRVAVFSLSRIDSSYLLAARLVDPVSGRDLFADRARADSRAAVLTALDRLVTRLRRTSGEPEDSLRRYAQPLPRVTTGSLPALRAFATGREAFARRDYSLASELFRRAVALDSNFAMAWLALAESQFNTAHDRVRAAEALERALALRERLTEREQLRLDQTTAFQRGRRDEGLRLAELLARRFPERESWYAYGTLLMQARRCQDAIPALHRAAALDPHFANTYINIATCHQYVGAIDSALVAYRAAHAADSTVLYAGSLNHEFGIALLKAGLVDSAARVYTRMSRRSSPADRGFGFRSLGYVAALRGQYRAAGALFDSAAAASREGGVLLSAMRSHVLQAEHLLSLGATGEAARALDAAWTSAQRLNLAPTFALYAGLAFSRGGQPERARAMFAAIDRVAATETDRTDRAILTAQLALSSGRPREALETLTQATDTTRRAYATIVLAQAYEALGAVDSARAAYQRMASFEVRGTEAQEGRFRGLSRLAELLSGARRDAEAAALDSVRRAEWRDGDPDHPILVAARRRAETRPNE